MNNTNKPTRKPLPDNHIIQAAIDHAEASHTFTSRGDLYKHVSITSGINANSIAAKVSQGLVVPKTPPGRRGKVAGEKVVGRKYSSKSRLANYTKTWDDLQQTVPPEFHKDLEKARGGSRRAAIKLKCLECSHYEQSEVRHCPVYQCINYPFRPYKTAEEKGA